jgi:hypothetical protein
MTLSALGIFSAAGAGGVVAASDYELIQTTILGSSQASIVFSSLGTYSSTYKHLQIRGAAKTTGTTYDNGYLTLSYNGDTTDTGYRNHFLTGNGSSVPSGTETSLPRYIGNVPSSRTDVLLRFGPLVIDVLDAYSTTKNKTSRIAMGYDAPDGKYIFLNSLFKNNTASITSLTIAASNNLAEGTRLSLYGVK